MFSPRKREEAGDKKDYYNSLMAFLPSMLGILSGMGFVVEKIRGCELT